MQIWKSFGDVLVTTIKQLNYNRVLLLNTLPHNEPHRLRNRKNLGYQGSCGYTAQIADFFYPVVRTCFIDL